VEEGTVIPEGLSKQALLAELRRLEAENELLRLTRLNRRPLSATATLYLQILQKHYGITAWTTPLCLHLMAEEMSDEGTYTLTGASSAALATLHNRGYIERIEKGAPLRLTTEGADA